MWFKMHFCLFIVCLLPLKWKFHEKRDFAGTGHQDLQSSEAEDSYSINTGEKLRRGGPHGITVSSVGGCGLVSVLPVKDRSVCVSLTHLPPSVDWLLLCVCWKCSVPREDLLLGKSPARSRNTKKVVGREWLLVFPRWVKRRPQASFFSFSFGLSTKVPIK